MFLVRSINVIDDWFCSWIYLKNLFQRLVAVNFVLRLSKIIETVAILYLGGGVFGVAFLYLFFVFARLLTKRGVYFVAVVWSKLVSSKLELGVDFTIDQSELEFHIRVLFLIY